MRRRLAIASLGRERTRSGRLKRVVLALLLIMLLPASLQSGAPDPSILVTPPPNVGQAARAALQYHDSGAYERDLETVGQAALGHLRAFANATTAKGKAQNAAKPCVVLDIDETAISNWPEIKRMNMGFSRKAWLEWVRTGDPDPIRPTLELFNLAKSLGIPVFFITGRNEPMRQDTIHDLEAAGYAGWAGLILQSPDDARPTNVYKTKAREDLEAKGYTVILSVGDQDSDLVGGHAQATFKLPNPFYWIPCGY